MIKIIVCDVCNEIIGTLEKPEITEADIQEYKQMVTCSNGHSLSITLEKYEE